MTNFCEIELTKICPNLKNPRKHHDPRKLEELAASIKQKGVIEPIIVRHCKGSKMPYEIVAGERRYHASSKAGLAKIPCVVRDLSDDEAYDFMLIENLQREDLTDAEEAHSFRAYVDLYSRSKLGLRVDEPTAIATLAEKTGINQGYIRSRLRILTLPSRILKLFDKGELLFGHLQQLLRVADDKKTLDETIRWTMEDMGWGDKRLPAVKDLRRFIDDLAPALSSAFFPAAATCSKCANNSAVQKTLFDLAGAEPGLCLRPTCFKKCQAAFLDENWKTTDLAKRFKTNGYRFIEDLRGQYHSFYSGEGAGPGKKCATCDKLVTAIEIGGKVHGERVCVGAQGCYNLVRNPRTEKEGKTSQRDPAAPRASWHGIYFRDRFLRARIAQKLVDAAKSPDPNLAGVLCLYALAKSNRAAREKLAGVLSVKTSAAATWGLSKLEKEIMSLGLNHAGVITIARAMLAAAQGAFLAGQVEMTNHEYPEVIMGQSRRAAADLLGISIAKEFSVDKDYLGKKTKAEILAFGKKFKLLKPDQDGKLKKPELIKTILAHGEKLVGKVPAEILK